MPQVCTLDVPTALRRTINSFTAGTEAWMWSPQHYVVSRPFTTVTIVELSRADGQRVIDGIAMGATSALRIVSLFPSRRLTKYLARDNPGRSCDQPV